MRDYIFLTLITPFLLGVLVVAGGAYGSTDPLDQARKGDPGKIYTSWEEFLEERRSILRPHDLHVQETFRRSLDGRTQHSVVLWHKRKITEDFLGHVEKSIVEVYELQPRAGRGVGISKIEEMVIKAYVLVAEMNGRDLNGDGLVELVLIVGSGGNCQTCQHIELFQLREGHLTQLPIGGIRWTLPERVEDIDGDGIFEVIALYFGREFQTQGMPLCQACSPRVEVVYMWEDGKYVEASQRFQPFYEAKIARLEQKLKSERDSGFYLSTSAILLMHYIEKGNAEQGWKRFRELMSQARMRFPDRAENLQEAENDLKQAHGF